MVKPTNIICIDIDKKDNPDISMDILKSELSKSPYIMYCGLSASGKGLFCLIKIYSYQQHSTLFSILQQKFELIKVSIDTACSDLSRFRFYSCDENPHINPDSDIFSSEKDCLLKSCPSSFTHIKLKKDYTAIELAYCDVTRKYPNESDYPTISLEETFLKPTIDKDTIIVTHIQSKKQMAKNLIDKIILSKVDITKEYQDWFIICCIIATYFKEEGRSLFLKISSFYPQYSLKQSNCLYDYCLQKEYHITIQQLFIIAQKYGIS